MPEKTSTAVDSSTVCSQEPVKSVSKVALQRLDSNSFSNNFVLLTRTVSGESITQLRNAIASLDPEELDALATVIVSENWDASIRRIHEVGDMDLEVLHEADIWFLICDRPLKESSDTMLGTLTESFLKSLKFDSSLTDIALPPDRWLLLVSERLDSSSAEHGSFVSIHFASVIRNHGCGH